MGPLPLCRLLTDFVSVPLACFLSKKIFAAFVYRQVKMLIVAGPLVIGNSWLLGTETILPLDRRTISVGQLIFENI